VAQERHNWLVDGSHTGNIHGSVCIGGSGMATPEATEMGLIAPVTFIAKTTDRTSSASVARVLPLSVVDNSGIPRSTSDDGQMQVLVTGSIDRERVCVSHSP